MGFQWSDVKTLVEANLGKIDDSVVASLLPIWAKLFQQTVMQDRNYWFLRQQGTLPITVGLQNYALPSGYTEGMTLYLIFTGAQQNSYVELKPLYSRQEVIRLYDPQSSSNMYSQPIHYLVKNTEFEVWPAPDKSYTLGADFWGDMAVPDGTDGFTNYLITYFPDLYVNYLTHLGFAYLQENSDAAFWWAKVDKAVKDLRARHVARVLGSDFVLRPRTDVYGDFFTNRGDNWVTYLWGS